MIIHVIFMLANLVSGIWLICHSIFAKDQDWYHPDWRMFGLIFGCLNLFLSYWIFKEFFI
jgi:predicted transglutaminase-like protease